MRPKHLAFALPLGLLLALASSVVFQEIVFEPPWTQADWDAAKARCDQLQASELPQHWTWELKPSPIVGPFAEFGSSFETSRGWLFIEGDEKGRLAGWLTKDALPEQASELETPRCEIRAFTADGEAVPPMYASSCSRPDGSGIARLLWYSNRELLRRDVIAVGIMKLNYEGRRKIAADAVAEAQSKGITGYLPFPAIGEPYDFVVRTLSGATITAEECRGKIVLIDFWATWCGHCVAEMPQVRQLTERFGEEDLVVIGVTWDKNLAKAQAACREYEMTWPQVSLRDLTPQDQSLVERITTIKYIPRKFILDRDGVLVADSRRNFVSIVEHLLQSDKDLPIESPED